jgi:hypothetical protein
MWPSLSLAPGCNRHCLTVTRLIRRPLLSLVLVRVLHRSQRRRVPGAPCLTLASDLLTSIGRPTKTVVL